MKNSIIVLLVALFFSVPSFGQKYSKGKQSIFSGRLAPHSQIRKGTKPNQVLMTLGDSSIKYVDVDTTLWIGGAPDYYYSTPSFTVSGDSLRFRASTWDPINRNYVVSPFGGTYLDNVFNEKVDYVKVNDTLLVNYSADFGNDTLRVSAPLKYKVYTFIMTAVGLMDPMVTVLDNTIGEIVWTRVAGGEYLGTLTGAFTNNKTWCILSTYVGGSGTSAEFTRMYSNTVNTVKILNTTESFSSLVEPMTEIHGEIRIYN